MKKILLIPFLFFIFSISAAYGSVAETTNNESETDGESGHIAIINMQMMILPGAQGYLEKSIKRAESTGAKLLIVKFDTPGGILQTTQRMMQDIFASKVPVVVYISPTGATATSAGVFITMAAHVAAMAPGTSLGSAHPVAGDGQDIEGDMRKKAEEMATALVKSVTEERGRNAKWAEKAVRDSVSLTDTEALKEGVIDIIAPDISELLRKIAGKKVMVAGEEVELADYSELSRQDYEMDFQDQVMNVLANPNIAALLWLAATTGISIELYNPGLIFPGVVGVICLVLALAVSQIVPVTQSGIMLLMLGAGMLAAEIYVGSGILAVGGIIAIVIGSLYLIDISQAPGMSVSPEFIIPIAVIVGAFFLWTIREIARARRQKPITGSESMVGLMAEVIDPVSNRGRVFVAGEYWSARSDTGLLDKGAQVVVKAVLPGGILLVKSEDK
jgi:membrane-bound serine protease (ClpP class)